MGKRAIASDEEVVKIREMYYKEGLSMRKLAKMYNVSTNATRRAIFGMEAYRDIPDTITEEDREKRALQERIRARKGSYPFWG